MKKTFNELKEELTKAITDTDTEAAHNIADEILVQVALNTSFTESERKELVELYQKVSKLYA